MQGLGSLEEGFVPPVLDESLLDGRVMVGSPGLVGGGALTLLSYMGKYMMPQHMKMDMLQMLGTMMLPAGAMAYGLGLMMHAVASAAFGLAYAGVL